MVGVIQGYALVAQCRRVLTYSLRAAAAGQEAAADAGARGQEAWHEHGDIGIERGRSEHERHEIERREGEEREKRGLGESERREKEEREKRELEESERHEIV